MLDTTETVSRTLSVAMDATSPGARHVNTSSTELGGTARRSAPISAGSLCAEAAVAAPSVAAAVVLVGDTPGLGEADAGCGGCALLVGATKDASARSQKDERAGLSTTAADDASKRSQRTATATWRKGATLVPHGTLAPQVLEGAERNRGRGVVGSNAVSSVADWCCVAVSASELSSPSTKASHCAPSGGDTSRCLCTLAEMAACRRLLRSVVPSSGTKRVVRPAFSWKSSVMPSTVVDGDAPWWRWYSVSSATVCVRKCDETACVSWSTRTLSGATGSSLSVNARRWKVPAWTNVAGGPPIGQ
mmetsp:Transcript_6446/g.20260  ORF Transcript_6446/g.20260 Transcript_6446/m.20260 type:complete len:304 (+) Transcript_6446:2274-3185(+)